MAKRRQQRSIDLDGDGMKAGEYPELPLRATLPSDRELSRLSSMYDMTRQEVRYALSRAPFSGDNAKFPEFDVDNRLVDLGPMMGVTLSIHMMQRFSSLEIESMRDGTHVEYAWIQLRCHRQGNAQESDHWNSAHMTKDDAVKFRAALSLHITSVLKVVGHASDCNSHDSALRDHRLDRGQ